MIKKTGLRLFFALICLNGFAQDTRIQYLSGTDKDHTVQWDFYCSGGRNSGRWTKIPVPSNWELQGFGSYNYGHDKEKSDEQGLYKFSFYRQVRKGEKTFIVFEGSMTDTRVKINGKEAGPVHQGSFYRFKYDITELLNVNGNNLLEVTVDKTSANRSVNDAERKNSDFWVFGGIFRPVYLEIVPATFIEKIAVNAKADGSFHMNVFPKNLKGGEIIEAQIEKINGEHIGKPFNVQAGPLDTLLELQNQFTNPLLWSSEFPNLYKVIVSIKNKQRVIHRIQQKFSFRTVELRIRDGLYINGAKIILKGSDRHSFWPETGRTLSYPIHVMDVSLMKEMNMNAVRMSHYPPDPEFLDVCDSLGLYVLDELTGWQAKYDTLVGHKLVKELVERDVNHPSVIIWDNGNEGGWNTGLDNDYALYDPQKRIVIHPWEKFNGTNTKHYPDYNYISNIVDTGKEVFFPTEFMHALYDGGAGAGLDDFWSLMMKHPHAAGGFIWAFLDEAVLRTDKNGIYDADGNHAPDGIVGPHREKEASFFTIKEIWSPVYINPEPVDKNFNGQVAVENRYAFTNLNQCRFIWKLVQFPSPGYRSVKAIIIKTGSPSPIGLKPGEKGILTLALPASWSANDALYLTAYGPDDKEIFTWSWPIQSPADIAKKNISFPAKSSVTKEETDRTLRLQCDGINYYFDKSTGYISSVQTPDATVPLSGGPVLIGAATELRQFIHHADQEKYIVESDYKGAGSLQVKWIFQPGRAVQLDYQYRLKGNVDFMGIGFNFPEDKVTGIKWLGRGPYRVWKNRKRGQEFGVWEKAYNNTITGENWKYPEFKGYHAEMNWVVIENKTSPITIYSEDRDTFLQMFHPAREMAALKNNNVEPPFPESDISILQAIPAIGTKFQPASVMGPQSQQNFADGKWKKGTLWFDFTHHL